MSHSVRITTPQLVIYMGRLAQVIGKQYGSRYVYSRKVYYDLKMLDSNFTFRSVPSTRCEPYEPENQGTLRLVKA